MPKQNNGITMSVKIVVGNIHSKIIGFLPEEVQEDLWEDLSYKIKGARFIPKVKDKKWDGIFRFYWRHQGQLFYTGLMGFVREILQKRNVEYEIVDRREIPIQNLPHLTFTPPPNYEERDYQDYTVDRSMQFSRGILSACTGSGKTMMVTKLISQIKTYPFIYYVLTKDLMEQAYDTLSTCLNEPIGKIGDGGASIKKISVCTIQTAIRALSENKDKIKVSDYKFDEEDAWDEKGIESVEKRDKIRKLIRMARGLYFDECVSGDTQIITEKGYVRMDAVLEKKCRFVLSHDGEKLVYKPISNWLDKGIKEIVKVKLQDGSFIKCTRDHLIYTSNGWKKAEDIKNGELVLCVKEEKKKRDCGSWRKNLLTKLSCASAVVNESCTKTLLILLRTSAVQNKLSILRDTISSRYIPCIISILRQSKDRLFWERLLGMRPFFYLINGQKTLGLLQRTAQNKKNGFFGKLTFCKDLVCKLKLLKTMVLGKNLLRCGLGVFPLLPKYIKDCIKITEKLFRKKYLMVLEVLDWRGGFVTMAAIPDLICPLGCTQKVLAKKKIKLWQNGFLKKDFHVKFPKVANTIICYLTSIRRLNYENTLASMCLPVCNTSWHIVVDVVAKKPEKVYDISVNDTHCFFGNGMLVHNCHHVSSRTAKEVLLASSDAYWRFAGSATPYREDGADIVIQALFGKKIVNISASYLIRRGYLVRPYIFFVPIRKESSYKSYAKIYKTQIAGNDEFNNHVAETANHFISRGLSTLILVAQYAQGEYFKKLIPNVPFVSGKMTTQERKQCLEDLRSRKIMGMIATTLADEGLDIPTLNAVILAGGGASATRVNQRIGRTLRQDKTPGLTKDKSIVIAYEHDSKFLSDHSLKVRKMLKKESEFKIVNSKGTGSICNEVDELLGFEPTHETLFDI